MKKKIYLVQTTFRDRHGILYQGKQAPFQSLALSALSSTIPQDWEKEFCLEYFENINYESDASVIGISCMAYDLFHGINVAQEFKKKGKVVIFGGYQPYFSKEMIKDCSDAVIFGHPGLSDMSSLLEDILNNQLKKEYKFGVNVNFPFDYSVYNNIKLQFPPVLSSIGCKNHCIFCCVCSVYKKFYLRDLNFVMQDLHSIRTFSKYACFVDSNIYNDRQYLLDLCERIRNEKLNLKWGAQSTIDIANDDEVLENLQSSGCKLLMIGLESLSQSNMKNVGKNYQTENYFHQIKKLKKYGIFVFGLFLLGLDDDKLSDFTALYNFIQQSGIVVAGLNILIPAPETPIYEQLKKEKRLNFSEDSFFSHTFLDKEICNRCYFTPKYFSPEELESKFMELSKKLASYPAMIKRSLSFNPINVVTLFGLNLGFRKQYLDLERDYK